MNDLILVPIHKDVHNRRRLIFGIQNYFLLSCYIYISNTEQSPKWCRVEILSLRPETLVNQSINQSINHKKIVIGIYKKH